MSCYCPCHVTAQAVLLFTAWSICVIVYRMVPTLQTLDLSYSSLLQANTSFLGTLPNSIGTLENLTRVDLRSYNFTRPIPTSMANLAQLFHMDFSSNHFSGPIPSLHKSRNLNYLDLSSNNLNEIHLLSNNQFENQFPEISNMSSSFSKLRLASSKPWVIPILKNQSQLSFFYISNNQISGEIPNWIWEVGGVNLYFLNLSQNLLVLDLSNNNLSGSIPACLITKSSTTLGRNSEI
ncbi:hypothetical protein CUMW_267680 [Citrus unshiu]|uniref:Leucine-rich repeat-containing N-terminal plant-type domain-containing protein n=1 Tax=Citrus unshiu TaxID=55188 RepID=A0A2H5QWB6_CITUN|nr:hypothetical protein CUMW_267680 [Citrus unshiu]